MVNWGMTSDQSDWESVVSRLEDADFQSLPPESIFTEDVIQALVRLRQENFLRFARIKCRLREVINLNDFRRAMKEVQGEGTY
jgi:hypothetical protein